MNLRAQFSNCHRHSMIGWPQVLAGVEFSCATNRQGAHQVLHLTWQTPSEWGTSQPYGGYQKRNRIVRAKRHCVSNYSKAPSANKSSGGENRWLEQCSRKSFSMSSNLSHTPHPKDFDKDAPSSTEDFSSLINKYLPLIISCKESATPLESGFVFCEKCLSDSAITPL